MFEIISLPKEPGLLYCPAYPERIADPMTIIRPTPQRESLLDGRYYTYVPYGRWIKASTDDLNEFCRIYNVLEIEKTKGVSVWGSEKGEKVFPGDNWWVAYVMRATTDVHTPPESIRWLAENSIIGDYIILHYAFEDETKRCVEVL